MLILLQGLAHAMQSMYIVYPSSHRSFLIYIIFFFLQVSALVPRGNFLPVSVKMSLTLREACSWLLMMLSTGNKNELL